MGSLWRSSRFGAASSLSLRLWFKFFYYQRGHNFSKWKERLVIVVFFLLTVFLALGKGVHFSLKITSWEVGSSRVFQRSTVQCSGLAFLWVSWNGLKLVTNSGILHSFLSFSVPYPYFTILFFRHFLNMIQVEFIMCLSLGPWLIQVMSLFIREEHISWKHHIPIRLPFLNVPLVRTGHTSCRLWREDLEGFRTEWPLLTEVSPTLYKR